MKRLSQLAILTVLLVALADLAPGDTLDAAGAEDVSAVFTYVRGEVTLIVPQQDDKTRVARDNLRVARDYQVIPPNATLTVPPGGVAVLVCSTDFQILLARPTEWQLTRDNCAGGSALEAGRFLRVTPRAGRLRPIGALMVVEHNSRGGGALNAPLLLSPRNTSVLDGRPSLRWTAVSSASEYQIELSGRPGSFRQHFAAADLDCAPDPGGWGEIRVCVVPYPAEWPELTAGQRYFLAVGARQGITSRFHELPSGRQLRRLSSEQSRDIAKAVTDVRGSPLAESARWVTLAGIYADSELFTDAITAYRRALVLAPVPELRVALGDVYLRVGLPGLAEPCYRRAAGSSDGPGITAAVAFGLGRSHLIRRRYREALDFFRRAQDGYDQLGLGDEAELAAQQAAVAEDRLPR